MRHLVLALSPPEILQMDVVYATLIGIRVTWESKLVHYVVQTLSTNVVVRVFKIDEYLSRVMFVFKLFSYDTTTIV